MKRNLGKIICLLMIVALVAVLAPQVIVQTEAESVSLSTLLEGKTLSVLGDSISTYEGVSNGAAAQTKWEYNTDALANANLTEAQKAYATVVTEKENILESGNGYYGTSLSLKENILMNVAFTASEITDVTYAVVTFVDHNGNDESVTVEKKDFVTSGSLQYIAIDVMAVADYKQPVTIELYNAAGEVVSKTVDSMGSYAGRQTKDLYLYEAILAFGMGAYNFFHS